MSINPVLSTTIESLPISVYNSNAEVGQAAAADAALFLQKTLSERGHANVILATGNSQLSFLETLRAIPNIDWSKVNIFHMDEYIDLEPNHPASFPVFLRRHFIDHLHPAAGAFFPVPGQRTEAGIRPEDVQGCKEYEKLLRDYPADLCALGIGENGHLAFNDPPYADFNDPVWVKVVELDEVSRRQQAGEGHFPDLESVPSHAITLTIPALLAARKVLAIVPEGRKASAVQRAMQGPIDPNCPASILRQTAHAHLYLDRDSAALTFDIEN
ncbi:MAG: glucosamine-6-phosphate deaminase [Chloroflexi bacterium HGW-Chloroflexi-10]|nr:MAG: glucosamine-6-phosphate deaminase [Chloroflexi bacterium HGW-Chloroflexi-10]